RVLDTRAEAHARRTAFGPVIELLRDYFHAGAFDDANAIRGRVADRVAALGLSEFETPLFALLDVPVTERGWDTLDPSRRHLRTLEAVKSVLMCQAQEQPLLLMFEDLHWVDGETQGLLDILTEGLASARLLLVVSYRPEYQHGWAGKPYYRQFSLEPLSGA